MADRPSFNAIKLAVQVYYQFGMLDKCARDSRVPLYVLEHWMKTNEPPTKEQLNLLRNALKP